MTTSEVYNWLEQVKDPEIPVLSIVDLGVITHVAISEDSVDVEITPTFVGCPAIDVMKEDIISALKEKGVKNVAVKVSYRDPWSSDKISKKGREALKRFGLSPPPTTEIIGDIEVLQHAVCPLCSGTNTELKNLFGPTLCRSIYYCHDCREAFEQFKRL